MTGTSSLLNKDLYQILDCTPNSTPEELKQAYHRKILKSHPDKNKDASNNTSIIFQEVKSAWEVLGNPKLRKEYDDKCRQTDLEAQGAVIYAKLKPSELEETEDNEILSYPCRCGNSYLVYKADLEEPNIIMQVPCQDCTFNISIET